MPATPPSPRRTMPTWTLVGAVVVLSGTTALGLHLWSQHSTIRLMKMLRAADSSTRQQAAWMVAARPSATARDYLLAQLAEGLESDPLVRESYVYALSQVGNPTSFDQLWKIAEKDPNPYVRQSAWTGAARLCPGRFVARAPSPSECADPWEQIGVAHGWLLAGDMRGTEALFRWAVHGSEDQRRIASVALLRGVAPLLEAIGSWPLDPPVERHKPWPTEFVARIEQACTPLDLQALADSIVPHARVAAKVRRDVGRLHNTRDRLASWLFE